MIFAACDDHVPGLAIESVEPMGNPPGDTERLIAGLHDLGVLSEEHGHLDRARRMFEHADSLASSLAPGARSSTIDRMLHQAHIHHLLADKASFHGVRRRIRRMLDHQERHDMTTLTFPDQTEYAFDAIHMLRDVAKDDLKFLSSSRGQLVTDITGSDVAPLNPRLRLDLARGRYHLSMENGPTVAGKLRVLGIHLPDPCRWLWPWYQPLLPRQTWEPVLRDLHSFPFYEPLLKCISFQLPAREIRDIADWMSLHVFGSVTVPVPFRGAEHHVVLVPGEPISKPATP